jgi:prevent-host-death family protein
MTTIGLFHAKTKLSELCEQVALSGEPVVVSRRGQPLVRIMPIASESDSKSAIWELRDRLDVTIGPQEIEHQVPTEPGLLLWNPIQD